MYLEKKNEVALQYNRLHFGWDSPLTLHLSRVALFHAHRAHHAVCDHCIHIL